MLRIGYRKKHLNINLILGLSFITLALIRFLTQDTFRWTGYGTIVISILYLGTYVYQRKYKYLSINNGILKINSPFGKEVKLSEINQIKKFAGDYIITTDQNKMTINTQIIDPDSLIVLNNELEKLDVEWV